MPAGDLCPFRLAFEILLPPAGFLGALGFRGRVLVPVSARSGDRICGVRIAHGLAPVDELEETAFLSSGGFLLEQERQRFGGRNVSLTGLLNAGSCRGRISSDRKYSYKSV